jgi:hypothetical protein
MPQPCSICTHPDRHEIDHAIANDAPNRRIATQYGLSEAAVRRHKADHLPAKVAKATDARQVVEAGSLLEQLQQINKETHVILQEVRSGPGKDNNLALKAIARLEKQIDLHGRIIGELQNAHSISMDVKVTQQITAFPEWPILAQVIDRHPEIRVELDKALADAGL